MTVRDGPLRCAVAIAVDQPRKTKDLVDDVCERWRRIDPDAGPGDVFLGPVQSDDEIALRWLRAPLVSRSLVEPPVQGFEIDVEDKDLVEQIDEPQEVARAAAEEGDRLVLFGHQGLYSTHVPDVMLVHGAVDRFASLGIALVGEVPVTVYGVVATPVQLSADHGLPGAGHALDQVVAYAHRGSISPVPRWNKRPLTPRIVKTAVMPMSGGWSSGICG